MAGPWEKYAGQQGGTSGPDPFKVEDQNIQREQANRAAHQAEVANANAANQIALARERFEFEKRMASQKNNLSPTERANAVAGYTSAAQLEGVIKDLEALYKAGPGSTSGVQGLADYLPFTENQQFDNAGNAARGIVGQALGFTGGQLNSVQEAQMAVGPYLPQSGDRDAVIQDKIRRLKDLAQTARHRSITMLGGIPDANGVVTPVSEAQSAPPQRNNTPPAALIGNAPPSGPQGSTVVDVNGPGGDGGLALATGNTMTENDPTLAGVNDRVRQMIDKGMSAQQIYGYLQSVGAGDRQGFNPVMPALQGAVDWKRQHPGSPYTGAVNVDDKLIPMTGARQMMNAVGQSPLGAYGINAADALTFGSLDSMTANPELTRAGMAGVSAANPKAAFAGQATGATLGTLGTGGVLGAAGRILGATGKLGQIVSNPLTADAIYGAGYGAGNNDENRLMGAVTGAGLGVVGNKVGQSIAKGLGSAVSGVTDPIVNRLNAAGIPLTLGQALGNSGRLGKIAKGFEDRLSGVPVIGDAINARRGEGLAAYNQAEFNRGLAPIGGNVNDIGPTGVDQAIQQGSNAYKSATAGVDVPLDPQYLNELANIKATAPHRLGALAPEFPITLDNTVAPEIQGLNMTGDAYQSIMQGLKRDKASFAGQPRGHDFGQAIGQVQDATRGFMNRAGGADVVSGLNQADKAWQNIKILQDAVARARNGTRSGDAGVFAPSQLIDAANASGKKWGGTQGTTRRPFTGLADDAQGVLPSNVPDSGTAGRLATLALPGVLAGGAASQDWIDPQTALLIASLSLPSSKLGAKAIRKGLFGGAKRQAIGDAIKKTAPALGQITSPLALTYYGQ